jgi:hypothetical protein
LNVETESISFYIVEEQFENIVITAWF